MQGASHINTDTAVLFNNVNLKKAEAFARNDAHNKYEDS